MCPPRTASLAKPRKVALVAEALRAFGPAIVPPLIDRLEARPELVERKVAIDVGTSVELSVVNELLTQRLAVLPPQSFANCAVVYLKLYNKNPDLQKAVATDGSGTDLGKLRRLLDS